MYLFIHSSVDTRNKLREKQRAPNLTFPFHVIAVGWELQGVCLIRSFNVININVQIIGCIQEVIGKQGPFTLIQGQVNIWGYKGAAFAVTRTSTSSTDVK